jgi:hypothetical protein
MAESADIQPECKLDRVMFYAAVVHPTGEYRTHEFLTIVELSDFVRGLIDRDVSVFCFAGAQLKISKPPLRYLLTPWGPPQPLFEMPKVGELEEDDTGYLGIDPIHFEEPPQIKMPTRSAPQAPVADEFFADDDSGGLDIFDGILPDPDN